MPSPCEVLPEQPAPMIQMDGQPLPRPSVTRVIPVVAGSLFAGLLLIALGCTPLFRPASAKGASATEQPIVVQSPRREDSQASPVQTTVIAANSSSKPAVATAAPVAPRTGESGTHGFRIDCDPAHAGDQADARRPETVALQGIMNGQSSKAALLDGALYREGDRFGSSVCPWTVAMIDVASVRIEKTFGDRTCGVTITFSREKTQTAQRASMN